ncbi:glycosyl hydrolase [Lyophyllum atratum]|nr:glycosyl hydrolase [Lyophyllum atratum]
MLFPFLLLHALVTTGSNASPGNIDPNQDLNALPDNALFTRWRPHFHFLAPSGWLNDPCSALYDPTRDMYHLLYQFHPNHANWGNISWGHAMSRDLITWKDVGGWQDAEAEAIGTGGEGSYDHLGIFSGTGQPVSLKGEKNGNLTMFYTSVQHLPIGWNREYIVGSESQSLATSSDGGLTWDKYGGNPILIHPPGGWDITGWRDPFFLPWPEMDAILEQGSPHYYVVFGSGIRGVGPRMPLYSAPASDLTNWTFLGALFEVGQNVSFGGDPTKTGTFGFNLEVSGVFSLIESIKHGGDGKTAHHFITTGTEGGENSFHPSSHWAIWAEGDITRRTNGSAQFDIVSSGAADWGNLYAITSFWDAKNSRRVSWGWSPEDMNDFGIKAQGFQGSMGIPRELFVHKTHNVLPPTSGVPQNSSATWSVDCNGTYTVTTLGVRPLPEVVVGLRASKSRKVDDHVITSSAPLMNAEGKNITADHFELKARLLNVTGSAGFIIRASPALEEFTTITYSSTTDTISVNRTSSSLITRFANFPVNGHFSTYTIAGSGTEGLDIHVFGDGSLVEVFINNRFALTTRIYPSRDDALGIWEYVEGGEASFEGVEVWTDMVNVWPGRPVDSSSALVVDSPEDTGNGAWWSGI